MKSGARLKLSLLGRLNKELGAIVRRVFMIFGRSGKHP